MSMTPQGQHAGEPGPRRRAARVGTAVVLLTLTLAGLVVAVTRPWDTVGSGVWAGATGSPSDASTQSPTPSATTVAPDVAVTAVFDEASLASLFLTTGDVIARVPGAGGSLRPGAPDTTWGLPAGAAVDPGQCTTAVTVVADPPVVHDTRTWAGDRVRVDQHVLLLGSASDAQSAFRALVSTIDACPTFSLVTAGTGDVTTWTTAPATEAQGRYPSLAQQREESRAGVVSPEVSGYVLVGNAIVSWTVVAVPPDGSRDDLGSPADLDAMVQARAASAVAALEGAGTASSPASAG